MAMCSPSTTVPDLDSCISLMRTDRVETWFTRLTIWNCTVSRLAQGMVRTTTEPMSNGIECVPITGSKRFVDGPLDNGA